MIQFESFSSFKPRRFETTAPFFAPIKDKRSNLLVGNSHIPIWYSPVSASSPVFSHCSCFFPSVRTQRGKLSFLFGIPSCIPSKRTTTHQSRGRRCARAMSELLRRWLHDDVGVQHPVDTFEEVSGGVVHAWGGVSPIPRSSRGWQFLLFLLLIWELVEGGSMLGVRVCAYVGGECSRVGRGGL